ncbi:DUF4062 domain-containing protein [Cryptosporangium sp. NPDC048952]|uniref:DUF4062 domain-containing protein n=1 Tax=Cryptosporangium sp. NPDC048952 TaxID=3363961 RepID=UPI003716C8E6
MDEVVLGMYQQSGVGIVIVVSLLAQAALRKLRRRTVTPCLHVYVSATLDDLNRYRTTVIETLRRLGAQPLGDPPGPGRPKAPLPARLAEIEGCDLFLGLYAWRYGPRPNRHDESLTDLELAHATGAGRPRILWVAPDNLPWLPSDMDSDRGPIEHFRARIGVDPGKRTLPSAPHALAREVEQAVLTRTRRSRGRQLLADVTSPGGITIAGVMATLGSAALVARNLVHHAGIGQPIVVGVGLATFAVCCLVRLAALRVV